MFEYEGLTAKKMPDSFNMRATQICIVPIYLEIYQNKERDIDLFNVLVSIENGDNLYNPVRNILVSHKARNY